MAVNATNGRESLADQAYGLVERMIVTLELQPGTVFSEVELSERIGIGRTPLREALQRLAGDRLVVALPRRGMMVTEINVTEYLALLDTRRVLDSLIVVRACRRSSPEQRRSLNKCADEIRIAADEGDMDAFMRLDRSCDDILEKSARNPFAAQAVGPLHAHCRRFWSMYKHNGDLTQSASFHAAIMEAVADAEEKKAQEASDLLIDYLERFTREALELI
ncbi:MAG: GntR family transcriptional regulator [Rhodothermia bacterium]|nr:MAG: GntR family transcriptional regulator [Rhodothermia bacterium]